MRRSMITGAALAALVLTGCASTNNQVRGPQLMGGAGSSASNPAGNPNMGGAGASASNPAMMGGGSDYHFSRLACAAPTSLPGRRVDVVLADMGMTQMMGGTAPMGAHMMLRATPAAVPAGQISLVAENMGWRTHELVILPLAADAAAGERIPGGDGKIDEKGSLGEASASCASGTGDGITAGSAGWASVTLAPGRYELVCNLQNHYADGMREELTVT